MFDEAFFSAAQRGDKKRYMPIVNDLAKRATEAKETHTNSDRLITPSRAISLASADLNEAHRGSGQSAKNKIEFTLPNTQENSSGAGERLNPDPMTINKR